MKQRMVHILIFFSVVSMIFSVKISEMLQKDLGIDAGLSSDIIKLMSISLLVYAIKLIIGYVDISNKKRENSISDISSQVVQVNNAFAGMSMKTDMMMKRIESTHIEVMRTSAILNGLNGMRLNKIRWNDEFDSDWRGIEESFKDLDGSIHSIARLIKESVKDVAYFLHSMDRNQNCEVVLNKFDEEVSIIMDKFRREAGFYTDEDVIDRFCSSIKKHKSWCRIEIAKTLNDAINNQDEAIQITMRQFMRRILNSFYLDSSIKDTGGHNGQ